MTPTPRLALALAACALTALFLPVAVSIVLALAIAAAAVVDAWWVRTPPRVERSVNRKPSRGRPAPFGLHAFARPGSSVEVRQATPPDVQVDPPQARWRIDGTLVARRRGRHELPPPATRSIGPLGLGAWHSNLGSPEELHVWPDMVAAHRMVDALRRSRFGDAGRRLRGPLGLGTDFESIRDYSPDDDIRQVNWTATARVGRPMSNQYRVEQDRDVVCVVDSGRLMGAPLGDRTRLDAAVDAVAAIASVTNELDDRCGLVVFDARVLRRVGPARRNALRVIEAVHDIEPSAVESDYELAFSELGGGKRSLVLVFTDLIEETAARPLVEAVGLLARRHAVIVAATRDRDSEAAVASRPQELFDSYRSAVALDVLEARARVTARLRSVGAEVVEAPEGKLGAATVRAYLRAKGRARL